MRQGITKEMVEIISEFGQATSGAHYILRPGGYLIVRNSLGEIACVSTSRGFFLPGGGQKGEESPEQAAVRETFEECGLLVKVISEVFKADELVFDPLENAYYRKRCVFFSAELLGCEEASEVDHQLVWLTQQDAIDQLSHRSQAWAVMGSSN